MQSEWNFLIAMCHSTVALKMVLLGALHLLVFLHFVFEFFDVDNVLHLFCDVQIAFISN